jgi:hypothetical protein
VAGAFRIYFTSAGDISTSGLESESTETALFISIHKFCRFQGSDDRRQLELFVAGSSPVRDVRVLL